MGGAFGAMCSEWMALTQGCHCNTAMLCVINHPCRQLLWSHPCGGLGAHHHLYLPCTLRLRSEELMYDYKFPPLMMPATRCPVPSTAEAVATCHNPCCQLGPGLGSPLSSQASHPPSCSHWMWACSLARALHLQATQQYLPAAI